MILRYVIGITGKVEKPDSDKSWGFQLIMPDGNNGGTYEQLDKLKDKKPPEGCAVQYLQKTYPLVAVQSGLYDLVFEVIIDTEECQELRLGTDMAVEEENSNDFRYTGVHMATDNFLGRRLRTSGAVQWRLDEGWYKQRSSV